MAEGFGIESCSFLVHTIAKIDPQPVNAFGQQLKNDETVCAHITFMYGGCGHGFGDIVYINSSVKPSVCHNVCHACRHNEWGSQNAVIPNCSGEISRKGRTFLV